MIDIPTILFSLAVFILGFVLGLFFHAKNRPVDPPEDAIDTLRRQASQAGLYEAVLPRRESSAPAPLELPGKPKRGRPRKIPVVEPERDPLIFTRPRRSTKLN